MLFQQFGNEEPAFHSTLSSKITYSQGTDVSQPLPISKQISLRSCASSLSISDSLPHSPDNSLFAPYLFADTPQHRQKAFDQMQSRVQMLSDQDDEEVMRLDFYQYAAEGNTERILEHFIKNWLVFMGYGSSHNKKYYISRAKALGAGEEMHRLTKIYRNPGLLGWTRPKTLAFLLDTCRNGWEHFIREVVAAVVGSKKESLLRQ